VPVEAVVAVTADAEAAGVAAAAAEGAAAVVAVAVATGAPLVGSCRKLMSVGVNRN
jgi:hypothetical protein